MATRTTLDPTGDWWGLFRQSAGGASQNFAGTLPTSFSMLNAEIGRSSWARNMDFGRGQLAQIPASLRGKTVFSLQEDLRLPDTVPMTTALADAYWAAAAANTLPQYPSTNPTTGAQETLQDYCLNFVDQAVSAGYPFLPIRINREAAGGLSNDAPLMTAQACADSVTFFRRVLPLMRARAAAGGLKLYIIWNACGGPESANNGILAAFPGWDMVDALGPDIYANTTVSGVWDEYLAAFPRWVYSELATATIAGATSLTRASFMISPAKDDLVVIGTGTANQETVTCTGGSGATITVTACTKPHAVGETILKQYPVGAKAQHFGQVFVSRVAANTNYPSPFPQGTTSAWRFWPYKPIDGSEGTPGVDCMSLTERQICLDAWGRLFNVKFHGILPSGGTANQYADKWYDFCQTGVVPSGWALDSRVASQTPRPLDFWMPELGLMGYPSWKAQSITGGDAFDWVLRLASWCTAKKRQDGRGVRGIGWWEHDNGTIPTGTADNTTKGFSSVYSVWRSRKDVYAGAPAAYYPLSGDALRAWWSAASVVSFPRSRYDFPDKLAANPGGRVNVGPPPVVPPDPTAPPAIAGFANTMNEQFLASTIDTSRWNVRTDAFGTTGGQDQQWQAANVVPGSTITGATGGKGLMLIPRKETVGAHSYTAGMLDSQGSTQLHPQWGRFKIRFRTPHYQGLWPAFWITCPGSGPTGSAGGATRFELDLFEYFHGQLPGKNSTTIYGWDENGVSQAAQPGIGLSAGTKYTNNGNSGRASRTLFESPANFDAGNWHTMEVEILPVTDSTGTTVGDVTVMGSANVRFKYWLDGTLVDTFVDTRAIAWSGSTQGGLTVDHFFNIYLQGCQMGGTFVGDVTGPLGFSTSYAASHGGNGCFNGSGTSPNACTVPTGARLADFASAGSDARNAFYVDLVQVYKAVPATTPPAGGTVTGPATFKAAGTPVNTGASGTATSIPVPLASTTPGDLNLVGISTNPLGGGTGTDLGTPAGMTGWALVKDTFDSGTPSNRLTVWGRIYQAGDPTTVTPDWTASGLFGNASAVALAYSGVDQAAPIGQSVAAAQVNSVATFSAGALTTTAAGIVVSFFGNRTTGTWTLPDTDRGQTAANSSANIGAADTGAAVAAGTYTKTATFSAASSVGNAVSLLVKSAT